MGLDLWWGMFASKEEFVAWYEGDYNLDKVGHRVRADTGKIIGYRNGILEEFKGAPHCHTAKELTKKIIDLWKVLYVDGTVKMMNTALTLSYILNETNLHVDDEDVIAFWFI